MSAPNSTMWRRYEAKCARYASERLGLDIITTRDAGAGRQLGYDLCLPDRSPILGYAIEAKWCQGSPKVTKWVRQAQGQCGSNDWVVWTNHQGASSHAIENSPGHGYAYCRLSSLVPDVGGMAIRRLSVATFVDLLIAFRGAET